MLPLVFDYELRAVCDVRVRVRVRVRVQSCVRHVRNRTKEIDDSVPVTFDVDPLFGEHDGHDFVHVPRYELFVKILKCRRLGGGLVLPHILQIYTSETYDSVKIKILLSMKYRCLQVMMRTVLICDKLLMREFKLNRQWKSHGASCCRGVATCF